MIGFIEFISCKFYEPNPVLGDRAELHHLSIVRLVNEKERCSSDKKRTIFSILSLYEVFDSFFLVLSNLCSAQKNTCCQIIDAILKYEPAKVPYWFDRNKEQPIVFVDTAKFLQDCNIGIYYGRSVEISNDSTRITESSASDYIISVNTLKKHLYKVTLFYKMRNAHSHFFLKLKRKKFEVIKFQEGYI